MNTISKAAVIITSFCLFLPAYAQNTASTAEQQMEKYTKDLQKLNEDTYRSQGLNERAIQAKLQNDLHRTRQAAEKEVSSQWHKVKEEHRNFTTKEDGQEVDKRLEEKLTRLRHTLEERRKQG